MLQPFSDATSTLSSSAHSLRHSEPSSAADLRRAIRAQSIVYTTTEMLLPKASVAADETEAAVEAPEAATTATDGSAETEAGDGSVVLTPTAPGHTARAPAHAPAHAPAVAVAHRLNAGASAPAVAHAPAVAKVWSALCYRRGMVLLGIGAEAWCSLRCQGVLCCELLRRGSSVSL